VDLEKISSEQFLEKKQRLRKDCFDEKGSLVLLKKYLKNGFI